MEETVVAATKDLCDLGDGGAVSFLSEIGVYHVESVCVEDSHPGKLYSVVIPVPCAVVVVELRLSLLVASFLAKRVDLSFVRDVKPFEELYHGFSRVFDSGAVIVA